MAEDHGNLIEALTTLHLATGELHWLDTATALLDEARRLYRMGPPNGPEPEHAAAPESQFADTPIDGEAMLWRPAARADNAEPCGQSAMAAALLVVGGAAGRADLIALGHRATAPMAEVSRSDPRFAGAALTVAEAATQGPLQLAISAGTGQAKLVAQVRSTAPPGVVAIAARDTATEAAARTDTAPLLADRPAVDGAAALYVCRGTVCDLPRTAKEHIEQIWAPRRVQ